MDEKILNSNELNDDISDAVSPETDESIIESPSAEKKSDIPETDKEQAENQPVLKNKFDFRRFTDIFLNGISLFSMMIGIFTVLYFIWGPSRDEFQADCTDTLYWADAAMQGKGLINPDFKYAALMPLGGNLLMQMWIPFFGVTMLTQMLGMTTFFVLFTASVYWLLHEMKWSLKWKGITTGGLLMSLSLSVKLREIFWGHIIYYSLGMLFLTAGLAMILHIYNLYERTDNSKKLRIMKKLFPVLMLVMFTVFCTNSSTAVALFALPAAAAIFMERFLDHSVKLTSKKNILSGVLLIITLAATGAGMLIGKLIAGDVTAAYADAYSHFTDSSEWWEHIERLPLALLHLLGLDVSENYYLMSTEGVNIIMLLAYTAVLVILPLAALFCYRKIQDRGLKLLIWSHFTASAFILIGYICGMLSSADWRLSPMLVTGFILSFAFMRWIYKCSGCRRLGVLLIIPAAFICTKCVSDITKLKSDAYLDNFNYRMAEFLKEHNLEYGYASFWLSQAITIQADNEIKVRNIDIKENGVYANPYQSCYSWYSDQEGQDDYFLLMNNSEYDIFIQSGSPLIDVPHEELHFLGCTIWIYDHNIVTYTPPEE